MTALTSQQIADAIRRGTGNRSSGLTEPESAARTDTYRRCLAHYREHVLASIAAGDYLQVAEKSWGAYAQTIKIIGAERRLGISHHAAIIGVANELADLTDAATRDTLDNGLSTARSMHQHFYEDDLSDTAVIRNANRVADVIDLMMRLFSAYPPEPGNRIWAD